MRSLFQKELFKKAAGLMLGAVLCLAGTDVSATTFTSKNGGGTTGRDWTNNGAWTATNTTNTNSYPQAGDIVIIQSGDIITVPVGTTISCASLTNNGTLNLNSETLNISETLAASGTFLFGTNSTVRFNGTALQTIPSLSYANIWVENTAGVQLANNLSISGNLTLFDNSILFNNGKTVSSSGSGKTLLLNTNSEIVLQGNTTLANLLAGLTPSLAITSTITYDASNTAV